MNNPPPYSERVPGHYVRVASTPGHSTGVNTTDAMVQSKPTYFDEMPRQMPPCQALPGNRPVVGYQPGYVIGQPAYPIGRDQSNILYGIPPYADESAYRNISFDANPLTSSRHNQNNQRDTSEQFNFGNESIFARAFVKKVYCVVLVQLLVLTVLIFVFLFHRSVAEFFYFHSKILFVAIGVYFVTAFLIACCEALRRTRPFNFIFSVLFTLNLGLLLGMLATLYQSDELLVAVGLTSAVCLTLLLFVFQTRCAFTGAGPYLFCVLIPLIFFAGLMAVMLHRGLLGLLFSSLTVMLFSCYLVYDTQLMIRGKYDHSLIADDYVILGLGIYLNIVIIFMKILWMLKRKIV